MIRNIRIECLSCRKVTAVKFSYRDKKPHKFSYACKNCENVIEGIYNFGNDSKLLESLHHGKISSIDSFDADYYQYIDSHFMVDKSTDDFIESLISPFIASVVDFDVEEFNWKNHLIEKNIEILFDKVVRIGNFYFSGNTKQLRFETEHIICDKTKIDLIKGMAQLNEMLIEPMLDVNQYSQNLKTLDNVFLNAFKKNEVMTLNLIETLQDKKLFFELQSDLFEVNRKFVSNIDLFNQRILLNYPRGQVSPQRLLNYGIISNTDFDSLKQIYIDSFETLGKSLTYLMGLISIETRNDFNNNPVKRRRTIEILNLMEYSQLSNAHKRDAFKNTPIHALIKDVMDNQLRNGIGHKKAKFNKGRNEVMYYPRNIKKTLSYPEFIDKIYEIWMLLNSLNSFIAKSILVLSYSKGERNLGIDNIEFKIMEDKATVIVNHYWNDLDYSFKEKEYEILCEFWKMDYFLKHYNLKRVFTIDDEKNKKITIEYSNSEYGPEEIGINSIKEWYEKSNNLKDIEYKGGILCPPEIPFFRMLLSGGYKNQ